jgi:hydroxymethylpyrimidine pyrophosphatase-like HAD family hydrolase
MFQSVTNALLSSPRKISLLLSDVDGILVTKEKILTDHVRAAVGKLKEAGIHLTISTQSSTKLES